MKAESSANRASYASAESEERHQTRLFVLDGDEASGAPSVPRFGSINNSAHSLLAAFDFIFSKFALALAVPPFAAICLFAGPGINSLLCVSSPPA